jgi:hypothetical protein
MRLRHNRVVVTLIVLGALGALGAPQMAARNPGLHAIPSAYAAGSVPQVYLPFIYKGGKPTPLEFASSIDIFGVPINPSTTLSYGITKLYASTVVYGGNQQIATMLFIRPGGGGTQGVLPLTDDVKRVTFSIPGSNGAPLDRGTYTVRFSLDGTLLEVGTVTIE